MNQTLSNTLQVKLLNKEIIRGALKLNEVSTKSSISKETGLSVATCGTILNEMLEDKEILEVEQAESNGGRPASQYMYNKDYFYVLGIYANNESGFYEIGYAISNSMEEIVEHNKHNPEIINYSVIENLISDIINKYNNIKAVGLGLPGVIYDGFVETCDIKALEKLDIGSMISKKFGVNIVIENDMNFITYGTYKKLHKDDNIAAIYFSKDNCTGCGFVVNGQVIKGNTMFSGEISYIAKSFGIEKEDYYDVKKFPKLASQMVISAITTINPGTIFLMGELMDGVDMELIKNYCKEVIPEKHIPHIIYDKYIHANYINGLISVTMNSLKYKFIL